MFDFGELIKNATKAQSKVYTGASLYAQKQALQNVIVYLNTLIADIDIKIKKHEDELFD